MKFKNAKAFVFDKKSRFTILSTRGFYNRLSDEEYLEKQYRVIFHRELDLKNPKTFNEKLQWIKLYDRKPIYTTMVDKYEAKNYISNIIGEDYLIPTLGVWERFEEIDFSNLPNEFVLKCTHDSGGLIICRDKNTLDYDSTRKKINASLRNNYYWSGREWPYKGVKPRIIAEPLIQNDDGSQLLELNVFCFNGEPRIICQCHGDRDKGEQRYHDFFDLEGNKYPFQLGYPSSQAALYDGSALKDIIRISEKMSSNNPVLRVDFYIRNDTPLIGELTLFHWSGFMPFEPEEWDYKLGSMIELN